MKKNKIFLGVIGGFLLSIAMTVVGTYVYINKTIDKTVLVEIDNANIGLTENEDESLVENEITNIALFGIDSEEGNVGRSDSIIIATIDKKNNSIKLTSIMRDSYVNIPGYKMDKINHAYAYGGPELAIHTLNYNFGLNIKDFVAVDFKSLSKIVDLLGGIEITVTDEEVSHIPNIDTSGTYVLNGSQTLAYSRIRKTSGGDYKRAERQRVVLTKMFEKITQFSLADYSNLLGQFLPLVETSINSARILSYGADVVKMKIPTPELERFPIDGYCSGEMIDGVYYLTFNIDQTKEQLNNYIFENKKIWLE